MNTAPEEVGTEEGDGPAVGVLRVEGPLDAEVVNQAIPEEGEGEEIEEGGWEMVFQCFSVSVFQCFGDSVFRCADVSVLRQCGEDRGSKAKGFVAIYHASEQTPDFGHVFKQALVLGSGEIFAGESAVHPVQCLLQLPVCVSQFTKKVRGIPTFCPGFSHIGSHRARRASNLVRERVILLPWPPLAQLEQSLLERKSCEVNLKLLERIDFIHSLLAVDSKTVTLKD